MHHFPCFVQLKSVLFHHWCVWDFCRRSDYGYVSGLRTKAGEMGDLLSVQLQILTLQMIHLCYPRTCWIRAHTDDSAENAESGMEEEVAISDTQIVPLSPFRSSGIAQPEIQNGNVRPLSPSCSSGNDRPSFSFSLQWDCSARNTEWK